MKLFVQQLRTLRINGFGISESSINGRGEMFQNIQKGPEVHFACPHPRNQIYPVSTPDHGILD